MNVIVIMGRLVADPIVKYGNKGVCVTRFRLAVNRPVKTKEGNEITDFINFIAYGGIGEIIGKTFKKGDRILVNGSLETYSPEVAEGKNRQTYTYVRVSRFDYVKHKRA